MAIEINVTPRRRDINIEMTNRNPQINVETGGGGGGYIPQINGIPLVGNKTLTELMFAGLTIDGLDADWVDSGE